MTSDTDAKTLAFLARRVGALEKKVKEMEAAIEDNHNVILQNQQFFRPAVTLLRDLLPLIKEELVTAGSQRQQILQAIQHQATQVNKILPPCFEEGHGI